MYAGVNMKKLSAVVILMLASGFVNVNAAEDFFADKPAPVTFAMSGVRIAKAVPEVLNITGMSSARMPEIAGIARAERPTLSLAQNIVVW